MRKIITNSTPVIGLSMIGKLSLLNELFDEVYVPEAVYNEIVNGRSNRKYGKEELKGLIEEGSFSLVQIKNKQLVDTLYGKLHEGELETIVGAKELGLQNVLLDEQAARSFAKTFLLRPIGTVGILLLAKKKGKVERIQPLLDELIANGIFLSKSLYKQVLFEAKEI
ncbi:DUF3368 domain-containing protein [Sporosarcina sp. HYO08]|uniref:DUF3368 domain-containing protein n=1 Tax=Sporosarcina sp. HYO08 TaxID=1759557 RepID=UPI000796FF57|nr:DUF3368 domain-containing protein [Sporosarcina sp. HYO08]KXH81973.1 nucleotide-binding protein [Sporosarcina sp. HYO08]